MDSHIFDYNFSTKIAITMFQLFLNILSSKFFISWCPRSCSPDYNWQNEYEPLLKITGEK